MIYGKKILKTLVAAAELSEEDELLLRENPRPRVRAECASGPRPCPHVSCRHHLALDPKPNGSLQVNPEGEETCALDVADRGPLTFEEIGAILGVSRQRAEQIASLARAKLVRRLG